MIEAYSFGSMTIDGKHYDKDVIILPDGSIIHPWWRKEGHRLSLADINDVVASAPDLLVVGTGDSGRMKPAPNLTDTLHDKGIETRIAPTAEAVKEFNAARKQNQQVAGCFHLTC